MFDIRLAVFDMAGTTVNEDNVVYKTLQRVLNEGGFDISLAQVLEHGAGKEKQKAIYDILTACAAIKNAKEISAKLFKKFIPALASAYQTMPVTAMEGVEHLFKTLQAQEVKVVLNTGYDRNTAEGLISKLGWEEGKNFDALITADDVEYGRPHPAMIQKAMKLFAIKNPNQVLKAGDSVIDIEEGKNAECGFTVGVLGGAQNREQLSAANPDLILEKLSELERLFLYEEKPAID